MDIIGGDPVLIIPRTGSQQINTAIECAIAIAIHMDIHADIQLAQISIVLQNRLQFGAG